MVGCVRSFVLIVAASALALAAAACGGDDDPAAGDVVRTTEVTDATGTDAPADAASEGSDDGAAGGGGEGTVSLLVNGLTFEAPTTRCEVSESTIALAASGELAGEPVDLSVTGSGSGDAWIIQAQVTDGTGAIRYQSSNSSTAEVSGGTVETTGEWVWQDEAGDLAGGDGVLTATCG